MTLLFETDQLAAQSTIAAIGGHVEVVDSVPALRRAVMDQTHDLVVIGPDEDLQTALELAASERVAQPALGVVLLRRRVDSAVLRDAMRSGVREVVKSDDLGQLAEACRTSLAISAQVHGLSGQVQGDRPVGQVVTVFSAKGGCGKTTVATNTSVALAAAGKRVCLVDLDLASGDVAIALQLYPSRTIADLVGLESAIDETVVRSLLTPHSSGVETIAAPINPGSAENVTAETVTELLRVLKQMYEVVVVDCPPSFTDHVLAAFDESDHYLLLATLDIPALKNLKLTLETLEALAYPRERRHVVLNRSDAKVGLEIADVEKTLQTHISLQVPSSRAVPAAINRGVPIVVDQPNHPVSNAIRHFATTTIAPVPVVAPVERGLRRFVSFRRAVSEVPA